MSRFSILNVLLAIALIGLGLALYSARRELSQTKNDFYLANLVADEIREQHQCLNIVDPNRYQVQPFFKQFIQTTYKADQFPIQETRTRLYSPEASEVEFFLKWGELPSRDLPEKGFKLPINSAQGPTEFSIVFMAIPMDETVAKARSRFRRDPKTGPPKSKRSAQGSVGMACPG